MSLHQFHIYARNLKTQECIVYLDSYIKAGDGMVDAYIDFRQMKDLMMFRQAIGLSENVGSYIVLQSLKSSKRLMRGCYYKLNLELLKAFELNRTEGSLLIGGSYELANMQTPKDEDMELLQQHEPLEPEDMSLRNVPRELPAIFSATDVMSLYVKDVDQANWNELRFGNRVVVLFDAGAKLHASTDEVSAIFDSRKADLEMSKPILMISHWDMDHIHCLKLLTKDNISRYFSKLICVDKMKSVTATDVFSKFIDALGKKNVWCISPAMRTNGIGMHLWRNMGCISIYVGEQSRNINYSGIVMFVKGTSKSANYTGDCRLMQAKSVYDQEATQGINTNEHVLVAPHHGGDYGASFRHYSSPCNDIAISVGANNSYGHPQKDMLRYLRSLGDVKRTNEDGDIEVML